MKRLFLALPTHDNKYFMDSINYLKSKTTRDSINWIPPNNMHLTIRFIGETMETRIPDIINAMETAVKGLTLFDSRIENIGVFGSSYKPRVIWAGWNDKGETQNLYDQVANELEKAGFPRDRQNFVPHLTLGRIRHIADKPYFNNLISSFANHQFGVSSNRYLILYESIIHPSGPEYKVLMKSELKSL